MDYGYIIWLQNQTQSDNIKALFSTYIAKNCIILNVKYSR